jgi:aldose 1-epimerase
MSSTNRFFWSATPYDRHEGKELYRYVFGNGQIGVTVISLGATITAIQMPDRRGSTGNIVAAYAGEESYRQNPLYLGAVIGRYANRIGGGHFQLDGRRVQLSVNDGGNHLHGGLNGFHRQVWGLHSRICTDDAVGVVLEYSSPDGEEGYPGNLSVQVTYLLDADGRFSIEYRAVTDKKTPVNLTNHSYFNLSAFEVPVIDDHFLTIHATRYTEKNGSNLPSGRILPVAGTPLDFSVSRRIGETIGALTEDRGLDHNYVIDRGDNVTDRGDNVTDRGSNVTDREQPGQVAPAAQLYDPVSGRLLRVSTDQPGIQVYTANQWDGIVAGQQGLRYGRHGAVALETQAFPDSPNHPDFPDTLLVPGAVYRTKTIFELSIS